MKYIVLLFLVVLVAGAVYLATLDGTYEVSRSRLVQADPNVVFNDLNDYRNWEDWGPWFEEDSTLQVTYAKSTAGVGASYSWTGADGGGTMRTLSLKEPEKIGQEIIFHTPFGDTQAEVYWNLDEEGEQTNVTWGIRGEMPFFTRFMAKDMEVQMGPMLERGLELFGENLDKKLKIYSIDSVGVVDWSGGFYLYLTVSSRIRDISDRIPSMMGEIQNYVKENGIRVSGSPFTLYHQFDPVNGNAMFSVCYPVTERILTDGDSDILTGFKERGKYFKVVLKGSYMNSEKAWNAAMDGSSALDDFTGIEGGEPFEVYVNDPSNTPNPADLITEIFIPVTPAQ